MKKIVLSIITGTAIFNTINGMEQSLSPITQNKPDAIPTLYALCKHQITKGYGETYDEQRTNALKSIEIMSEYVNDYCINDFKRSFIHNHWKIKKSPKILIESRGKLYGMVRETMHIWDMSNIIDGTMITQAIDTLHTDVSDPIIKHTVVSKNGSCVYTAADNSMIKIWDTDSYECKGTLPAQKSLNALSENSYGDLCSLAKQGEIKIWDITTQTCKQTLPKEYGNVTPWRLLADTHMLYAAGGMGGLLSNGPILIYDIREGKCIHGFNPHGRSVTNLAKSKKDMQFYSSSWDDTIKIWDMRNMTESVHTLESTNSITCVQENSTGTQLFSCGNGDHGCVINVWDLTTDKPCITKSTPHTPIRCMAYDEYENETRLFIGTNTEIKIVMPNSNDDTK